MPSQGKSNVVVDRIEAAEWRTFSEDAHAAVFQEKRPSHWDRIDYALLAVENGALYGYCTVRELDSESVYLQYGGAFPSAAKSIKTYRSYGAFLEYFQSQCYRHLTTLVENTNIAYLKLAFAYGFRVIGVRMFDGHIFVELYLNLPILTKENNVCGQP